MEEEAEVGSTRTLVGVSIEALKSALAATTRAEVLLAEAMATEVLLEEGISKTTSLEEEEETLKSSFTNIEPLWIKVTTALWEPLKAQLIRIGTVIQMKTFTTITMAQDMVIITITDNHTPFEKVSLRQHQ